MKNVFIDTDLQDKFEKDGIVKVPFLTPDEIAELTRFYADVKADVKPAVEFGVTYHVSLLNPDTVYKQKVYEKLFPIFKRLADTYLNHYEPIVLNFILKPKGEGEFTPHQNWTFVDETKFSSLSLWIPLVDVNINNGAVEVVKGSHRHFRDVLRGPTLPTFFYNYAGEIKSTQMERVDVKAGEALIFDDSIIHCSMPNNTDEDRIVVHSIATPVGATLNHFVMKKALFGPKYYAVPVSSNYYLNSYNPNEAPQLKKEEEIKYKMPKISYKEFVERMNS